MKNDEDMSRFDERRRRIFTDLEIKFYYYVLFGVLIAAWVASKVEGVLSGEVD